VGEELEGTKGYLWVVFFGLGVVRGKLATASWTEGEMAEELHCGERKRFQGSYGVGDGRSRGLHGKLMGGGSNGKLFWAQGAHLSYILEIVFKAYLFKFERKFNL